MPVLAFVLSFLLVCQDGVDAERPSEVAGIEAAVRDYLHAFYDAEPSRLDRSVVVSLNKIGLARRGADDPYALHEMTFAQAVKLAAAWNKDGRSVDPAKGLQRIEVLGIHPKIACARLTAAWGVDYFHLVRVGERWKIHHVLWQSHPGEPGGAYQPTPEDRAAARKAGEDYINAFYKAKPELLDRSVDRDLKKLGFQRASPGDAFQEAPMDFAELRKLAAVAFAGKELPADIINEVRVVDLLDRTGVLEVRGVWGVDFVNVARVEDRWKIMQVIWQSHPTSQEAAVLLRVEDSVNSTCPFSKEAIRSDSLALYSGGVVGFCNPDCRDKFVRSPASFAAIAAGFEKQISAGKSR